MLRPLILRGKYFTGDLDPSAMVFPKSISIHRFLKLLPRWSQSHRGEIWVNRRKCTLSEAVDRRNSCGTKVAQRSLESGRSFGVNLLRQTSHSLCKTPADSCAQFSCCCLGEGNDHHLVEVDKTRSDVSPNEVINRVRFPASSTRFENEST